MPNTTRFMRQLPAFATLALTALTVLPAAALVADTGMPTGLTPPLVMDASDFVAGRIQLGNNTGIGSVQAWLDGGAAGETFTIALYDDTAGHLPGKLLASASATYGAAGWNGLDALDGLHGWNAAPNASLWIAIELGAGDTLGSAGITGALLPTGAPSPLAFTAFYSGGPNYQASATPLGFGLRVSAVPEVQNLAMLLSGIAALVLLAQRRGGHRG